MEPAKVIQRALIDDLVKAAEAGLHEAAISHNKLEAHLLEAQE